MIIVKKIVPFNNVLTFDTDVNEIMAISLEHDIKKTEDAISGVFYITGEYKMTAGSLDNDKFSFDLPFDIALGSNYNLDTLVVDIDDFRYELLDRNRLKVNIDLYIDGEVKEDNDKLFTEEEIREMKEDTEEEIKEPEKVKIEEPLDLLDEMIEHKEENMEEEVKVENNNENINIFNGFNEEEKYVTYHVYPVVENDTLDKILEKYQITKEELAQYNGNLDIHPGDKLIIPAASNDK